MILSQHRPVPRAGFSLLELLAVVSILVVLMGVGGVVYFGYVDSARKDTARVGVDTVEKAVMGYRQKYEDLPGDLRVLTQVQPDGSPALLEERHLFDPWQREYRYDRGTLSPTGKPRIYSDGPRPGDQTSIISNW